MQIIERAQTNCKLYVRTPIKILSDCSTPVKEGLICTEYECNPVGVKERLNTIRLLLSKVEVNIPFTWLLLSLKESFTLWQQYCCPQYYDTALEERIYIAIYFTKDGLHGPELFKTALARNDIPHSAVTMRGGDSETLLHAVVCTVGEYAWPSTSKIFPIRNMTDMQREEEYRALIAG